MKTGKIDLTALGTTRGITIATAVFSATLLVPAIIRAYPFDDDDVNPTISAGNDWLTYKQNALSILRDGLSMPLVNGNYTRPGGFLYNYFVAGIFAMTGVNTKYVYLAQALLLALSVGLMAFAFKPFMTQTVTAIYFLLLVGLYFLEVFCIYTFRLLSENLVIFLLAVFCLLALQTFARKSFLFAAAAGIAGGLCALNRPNLVLLPLAVTALLIIYLNGKGRIAVSSIFLACALLTFTLLPLRNYVVTRQASLSAITYTRDWERPQFDLSAPLTLSKVANALGATVGLYGRRILFCFGLTFFYLPFHWLRPHWLIIWAGAFVFCWRCWKRRRLEFWQAFAIIFAVCYLGPLIAVAQIYNYGVRMIVPVLPMLLIMAVAAFASPLERIVSKRNNAIR